MTFHQGQKGMEECRKELDRRLIQCSGKFTILSPVWSCKVLTDRFLQF